MVALAIYHAAFVAEALRSGINTVPQGQAEAARAIGLAFLPTLTTVVLPQAFRGAIAPLGQHHDRADQEHHGAGHDRGGRSRRYLMRNMIEFNISLLYAIFIIMAAGFVILTLPMGLLLHLVVAQAGGAAMSAETSVLFDAPGPKARRRHRIADRRRRPGSCSPCSSC